MASDSSLGGKVRSAITVDRFKGHIDIDKERTCLNTSDRSFLLDDCVSYVDQLLHSFELIHREIKQADEAHFELIAPLHRDISMAYANVEALDGLMEEALQVLESEPESGDLDKVSTVCETSSKAKKQLYPLKRMSDIATQYMEIKATIMETIDKEVSLCLDEATALKADETLMKPKHRKVSFEELHDLRLPSMDSHETELLERFAALRRKAEPLKVSITYIPHALDLFSSIAKAQYPECVRQLLQSYTVLVEKYSELDSLVKTIQDRAVIGRWNQVFDGLRQQVSELFAQLPDKAKLSHATLILEHMGRIISEELGNEQPYVHQYDALVQQLGQVMAGKRRPRSMGQRRVVSMGTRPGESIIASLDMRPVMIESNPVSVRVPRKSKDLIETMDDSERTELQKSSRGIIDRLMDELNVPVVKTDVKADPEDAMDATVSKPQLSRPTRTPLRERNDNPFTTPSIRTKSKLPQRTPVCDRQIKYVPLPVTCLDMEMSKLRVAETTPPRKSRIPLPIRPESRLSIQRSESRMGSRCESRTGSIRPPSRLQALGKRISSRNGTRSPSIDSDYSLERRPRSAMGRMGKPVSPVFPLLNPRGLKVRAKSTLRLRASYISNA